MERNDSNNPTVSVVIPVYNVGKYITYTLNSLINQTFTDFELILVDDGSKDDSIKLAEQVLISSSLVWRIIKKDNGGAASARNLGIEQAKGEWIICPDSDDIFAPVMIERLLKEAIKTGSKCVVTNYESTTLDGYSSITFKEISVETYSSEEIKKLFLERKLQLISPGMLVHKSICKNLRYNTQCPYDEDVYYVWEVLYSCSKITFIDSNYYLYVTRPGSTVHSLRPDDYLKTSKAYYQLENNLIKQYPSEKDIILRIRLKYKLGGLHVLAKTNSYDEFKETVFKDSYRKGMLKLIFYPNLKLSLYALIYCLSLRAFYLISREK